MKPASGQDFNVLRYPTEREVNPSTVQFRCRGELVLKLGYTIHNQEVTMVSPNFRMSILWRATTQLEQDCVSEAHAYYDLRLTRTPEQTLVIAMDT